MRVLIIYLVFFMAISCAKDKAMMKEESTETLEFDEEYLITNANADFSLTTNNKYHQLIDQKLNELIEIQQFKKEHPEFKSELEEQFLKLSSDSLLLKNTTVATIEHLEYLTPLSRTSDSTEQINLKIKRGTITDSLTAIITSSKTYIEGKLFENKSIVFTAIKE